MKVVCIARLGYLLDLRSVFRNCLLRRSVVDDDFAHSNIWKRVKDVFALCQKLTSRTLQTLCKISKSAWSAWLAYKRLTSYLGSIVNLTCPSHF